MLTQYHWFHSNRNMLYKIALNTPHKVSLHLLKRIYKEFG